MSEGSPDTRDDCLRVLDAARAAGSEPGPSDIAILAAASEAALDDAVRRFTERHGAAALDVLTRLAGERADRRIRRAARRGLYRLAQRGIQPRAPAPARAVVLRQRERAVRAWLSAVDGSGSRAVWIVFESGFGGLALCSLIVSDTIGIVEVAGGDISKKRLAAELDALRRDQKLPWVETDPARAVALVLEALGLHARLGTVPPTAFERWRAWFDAGGRAVPPTPAAAYDAALVDRAPELLDLPEMAGWFLDPDSLTTDAVELLQARESRLVVSDQVKAEREDALVTRVIERELDGDARARWSRRLMEMALLFRALDRDVQANLAEAAAAALADTTRDAARLPFVRALARRGLDIAGEVALGRISAAEVSRRPGPVTGPRVARAAP